MAKKKEADPEKADALLEAEACGKVISELDRLIAKYDGKVRKEAEKRRQELETAMGYHSEDEIRDAYGWDYITEAQMELYIDLLHQGEDVLNHHAPTVSERTVAILRSISADIARERQDHRYEAMTPDEFRAELKRQQKAEQEWKEHIKELKKRAAAARDLPEAG